MPPFTILAIIIGAALPLLAVAIIGVLTLRRALAERRRPTSRPGSNDDPSTGAIAATAFVATSAAHCDGGGSSSCSDGGGGGGV